MAFAHTRGVVAPGTLHPFPILPIFFYECPWAPILLFWLLWVLLIFSPLDILQLSHGAELPRMDAIWGSKAWHTALPRRCRTNRNVGKRRHSGRFTLLVVPFESFTSPAPKPVQRILA